MDTISINEAILVRLAERDNVDGTNVVLLMRNAQENVCQMLSERVRREGRNAFLNIERDIESADSFLDMVELRNGPGSLFA